MNYHQAVFEMAVGKLPQLPESVLPEIDVYKRQDLRSPRNLSM